MAEAHEDKSPPSWLRPFPESGPEVVESVVAQLTERECRDITKGSYNRRLFGWWIRNTYRLWDYDTPLKEWYRDHRFPQHPDDLSAVIMGNLERRLRGAKG